MKRQKIGKPMEPPFPYDPALPTYVHQVIDHWRRKKAWRRYYRRGPLKIDGSEYRRRQRRRRR